jgi:hypothetical protein
VAKFTAASSRSPQPSRSRPAGRRRRRATAGRQSGRRTCAQRGQPADERQRGARVGGLALHALGSRELKRPKQAMVDGWAGLDNRLVGPAPAGDRRDRLRRTSSLSWSDGQPSRAPAGPSGSDCLSGLVPSASRPMHSPLPHAAIHQVDQANRPARLPRRTPASAIGACTSWVGWFRRRPP